MNREVGGKRWRDIDWIVHADGGDGNDLMLCGDARMVMRRDEPMRQTNRRITCARCIRVIDTAKAIKGRFINRECAR